MQGRPSACNQRTFKPAGERRHALECVARDGAAEGVRYAQHGGGGERLPDEGCNQVAISGDAQHGGNGERSPEAQFHKYSDEGRNQRGNQRDHHLRRNSTKTALDAKQDSSLSNACIQWLNRDEISSASSCDKDTWHARR
jgi:hypothetical protein